MVLSISGRLLERNYAKSISLCGSYVIMEGLKKYFFEYKLRLLLARVRYFVMLSRILKDFIGFDLHFEEYQLTVHW